MALPSTIFKADLNISDMDRNYYADHQLTLARHPSETDERMMVRLLAFILHANERLSFTKGLCVDEDPALWQKNYTDEIELWIDVGLPDEKRLRKACTRAQKVIVFLYGGRSAEVWWQKNVNKLSRFDNLLVMEVPEECSKMLTDLVKRSMQLQCSIQDQEVLLSSPDISVSIAPVLRKSADQA